MLRIAVWDHAAVPAPGAGRWAVYHSRWKFRRFLSARLPLSTGGSDPNDLANAALTRSKATSVIEKSVLSLTDRPSKLTFLSMYMFGPLGWGTPVGSTMQLASPHSRDLPPGNRARSSRSHDRPLITGSVAYMADRSTRISSGAVWSLLSRSGLMAAWAWNVAGPTSTSRRSVRW